MRTELSALRSVPAYLRAIALAIAFSGFLGISYLGVKDLASTTSGDARRALSSGAVAGFVAVVYAAASAGGEVSRGGLALSLIGREDRRKATLDRLGAYAAAGAVMGLAGALTAAVLTYVLLGIGGGPLPGPAPLVGRVLGATAYGALMGVAGAAIGLAIRSPAAAVVTVLLVLLVLDPFAAGLSTEIARWGPTGAGGALTASGADDLPPALGGAIALLVYATGLGALATALTQRRDVP